MTLLKTLSFLFIAINFIIVKSETFTSIFMNTYFQSKYIYQVVTFGCWDSFERAELFDRKLLNNMKMSYIDIGKHDLNLLNILKLNYYKLGVILDLDCPSSKAVFDQVISDRIPFNESYFWLILTQSTQVPTDHLYDLPLTVATEMTLAMKRNETYVLYDVFNFSYRHGGRLNVTYMGYFTKEDGLHNELTQYKYKRRQNFHGLSLNFSICFNYPVLPDLETYLTVPINRHHDTMIRFHYNIVLQLRDIFNFTVNLMRTDTWGFLINGTFNGILGDMIKGIVDVGVSPFQYKTERFDICEFTVPTLLVKPYFIFRHPKKSDVRNVFLKPFTNGVWWIIILVASIYWTLLLLAVKIEIYFKQYPGIYTLQTNPESETALITLASVCQQGLSDSPRIYSGRIVFLSLFLWGLLLYQFYSASIVGSLLSEPPRFIKTLKDLSDSHLEAGAEDIAYNYDYFRTTTDPVGIELGEKKIKPNHKRKHGSYYSAITGLKMVQKGGFAFYVDTATAYKIITDTFTESQICDLEEVLLIPPREVSIVTSKYSPFKKMITYALRQIVQSGITTRLRDVWHHRKPRCPESHSSEPVPVELKEFSPALLSLLLGFGVSFMVMFGEILVDRYQRIQKEKFEASTTLEEIEHTEDDNRNTADTDD